MTEIRMFSNKLKNPLSKICYDSQEKWKYPISRDVEQSYLTASECIGVTSEEQKRHLPPNIHLVRTKISFPPPPGGKIILGQRLIIWRKFWGGLLLDQFFGARAFQLKKKTATIRSFSPKWRERLVWWRITFIYEFDDENSARSGSCRRVAEITPCRSYAPQTARRSPCVL